MGRDIQVFLMAVLETFVCRTWEPGISIYPEVLVIERKLMQLFIRNFIG